MAEPRDDTWHMSDIWKFPDFKNEIRPIFFVQLQLEINPSF